MTAGPTVVRRRDGVVLGAGPVPRPPHPIVVAMRAELAAAEAVARHDAAIAAGSWGEDGPDAEDHAVHARRSAAIVDYLAGRLATAERAFGRG